MAGRFAFFLMSLAVMSMACAADVYRWTDGQGKSHASDRPPERHQGKVRRDHYKTHELTERQREEAKSRALAEKSLRDRSVYLPPAMPTDLGADEPLPEAQRQEIECERMTRLYRESEACFAPYKLWNGATRAEAFQYCAVVVEPSIKCGYVK
ncbi:MAG: DUF4124 domain-containing protein [Aquabacterium sp.]|uniref:DUF4124 domain-containing protein n=1 Tax=Aquabacterium sp. TaxID=1872578 RepID=UPI002720BD0F|nr:DUF4124 domain-containing protein [Aquabacterium sp.]MDO9002713.1 DUF4124 domain-containing protein [Aquabacterium sp.]